jgi:uncharacterized protein (DUF983 family)
MPLTGLSGNLWPIHPQPLPDELLTSWLQRLAFGNGIKVQTLCDQTFGRNVPVWNRDFDRSAPAELIHHLSLATGTQMETIEAATLRGFGGAFVDSVRLNGNSLWILPLGIFHRKRHRFGTQYCPICLRLDPVPYYRRSWRLAFIAECPDHHCVMHDRCPTCGAAIVFQRIELGTRWLRRVDGNTSCAVCGFDLRQTPASYFPWVDGKVCVAYRSLMLFHWFAFNTTASTVTASQQDLFSIFHTLANILLSRRINIKGLGESLGAQFPGIETARKTEIRELELLCPLDRVAIFEAALHLLMEWPSNLKKTLWSAGVTYKAMMYAREKDTVWTNALRSAL